MPIVSRAAYALVLLAGLLAAAQTSSPNSSHLRRGVNVSGWFAQVYDAKGYSKEHFQTYITAPDIALIKSMGFDHVRLSVNPQPMFNYGHADQLPRRIPGLSRCRGKDDS